MPRRADDAKPAFLAHSPYLRSITFLSFLATAANCANPPTLVSEAPIEVQLGPGRGGMIAIGQASGDDGTWPMLVDTATVLTTRSGDPTQVIATNLRLYDNPVTGTPVARAEFDSVGMVVTPLGPVGMVDTTNGIDLTTQLGGVLGGDLLQRFSLKLHYPGEAGVGAPSISLLPSEIACSCALADDCQAVLPFTLAGGGTYLLGDNVYTYPATRVTLDACLEPVVDPEKRGECCMAGVTEEPMGYGAGGAPGVDVKLLVATGFPGFLLGASAYDRLCDAQQRYLGRSCAGGDAQSLLAAGPSVEFHFPAPASTIGRAVKVRLGDGNAGFDPPLAALAIVGREGVLSACQELARSRRLRSNPGESDCNTDTTFPTGSLSCLVSLAGASGQAVCGDPDHCNDRNQAAAAYVELDQPIDVYVVDDTAPILQEVNFDVRPTLSDVEGVVGSELLARLSTQIDYGNRRIIAHCNDVPGCTAYPRYACPSGTNAVGDCGDHPEQLCNPPSSIIPGGPLCLGAPGTARPDAGPPGCDGASVSDGGTRD